MTVGTSPSVMAVKLPNSALGGEIGIGRLVRRCGVASCAAILLALADIIFFCKDGGQMYAWRRSANRVFARSACSINECLLRANNTCSRCSMHACEHQIRVHCICPAFSTIREQPPESPRARRQRLVPTRCYGSGRRALPNPASLARARARGTSRQSSGLSVVLPNAQQPSKR